MDARYFKEQIHDELHGAKCYAKKAIEIMPMNSEWGKAFYSMASMELEHATNLYKMFNEYYAKLKSSYKEMPVYIEETKECIADMYAEKYAAVKYLQDAFNHL